MPRGFAVCRVRDVVVVVELFECHSAAALGLGFAVVRVGDDDVRRQRSWCQSHGRRRLLPPLWLLGRRIVGAS